MTLLDSLGKRVDFLKEVCDAAGAEKRAPASTPGRRNSPREHREQFDLAASRAVAQLNVLCELTLPLVKVGGQFAAMKSVSTDEEIRQAHSAIAQLGGQLSRRHGLHRAGDGRGAPHRIHRKNHSTHRSNFPGPLPGSKKRRWYKRPVKGRKSMGKIIAVASGKGGTGKTTFTANVGTGAGPHGAAGAVPGL